MLKNIGASIDIGSFTIKIIVGEFQKGETNPKVIGVAEYPTAGMKNGNIVNSSDLVKSLKNALLLAEKNSGVKITKAFVSVNHISLKGEIATSITQVSKSNGEVENIDINKALALCEENLNLENKKILHIFPISYKLDGREITGRIEGMFGSKLEIKSLIITCSKQHIEDLVNVIAEANVETTELIAAPYASSLASLSKKQKNVGVALVNIGAETMSVLVFENENPIFLQTFKIGSSDITNDIALGFKIELEKAENIKLGNYKEEILKKKLEEIINARTEDMLELIGNSLKKIKRAELLPAGVIFIGGGAKTNGLCELSKNILKLPSKIGDTDFFGNVKTKLRDPVLFVTLGLLITNKNIEEENHNDFSKILKRFIKTLKTNIKQLLP